MTPENLVVRDVLPGKVLSAVSSHHKITHHSIASCVESVYILIGYPGKITKPDLLHTMSWDKMVDRPVGPEHPILGVKFLNKNLEMTVDDYKLALLLKLLNIEWSKGLKDFTAIMAVVLINKVYKATATLTCTWLRWSPHHLINAMKVFVRNNFHRLV